MLVIPALERLRQEDHELVVAGLGYRARTCLKTKNLLWRNTPKQIIKTMLQD
jgi:hypothetical protein